MKATTAAGSLDSSADFARRRRTASASTTDRPSLSPAFVRACRQRLHRLAGQGRDRVGDAWSGSAATRNRIARRVRTGLSGLPGIPPGTASSRERTPAPDRSARTARFGFGRPGAPRPDPLFAMGPVRGRRTIARPRSGFLRPGRHSSASGIASTLPEGQVLVAGVIHPGGSGCIKSRALYGTRSSEGKRRMRPASFGRRLPVPAGRQGRRPGAGPATDQRRRRRPAPSARRMRAAPAGSSPAASAQSSTSGATAS